MGSATVQFQAGRSNGGADGSIASGCQDVRQVRRCADPAADRRWTCSRCSSASAARRRARRVRLDARRRSRRWSSDEGRRRVRRLCTISEISDAARSAGRPAAAPAPGCRANGPARRESRPSSRVRTGDIAARQRPLLRAFRWARNVGDLRLGDHVLHSCLDQRAFDHLAQLEDLARLVDAGAWRRRRRGPAPASPGGRGSTGSSAWRTSVRLTLVDVGQLLLGQLGARHQPALDDRRADADSTMRWVAVRSSSPAAGRATRPASARATGRAAGVTGRATGRASTLPAGRASTLATGREGLGRGGAAHRG